MASSIHRHRANWLNVFKKAWEVVEYGEAGVGRLVGEDKRDDEPGMQEDTDRSRVWAG